MYLKSFVFLPEMGVRKDVGYLQTSTTIPCGGWLNQCSFPSSTFPSSSFPFSFTLKSLKILFQSQLILPMSLFSPRIKQNLPPPSFFRPSHFLSLLIPFPTCIQGDRDYITWHRSKARKWYGRGLVISPDHFHCIRMTVNSRLPLDLQHCPIILSD